MRPSRTTARSTGAPPGQITERYEVLRLLGRGGMGEVYEVTDRKTGSRLALKRIHPPENPRRADFLREMFAREFRVLKDLAHPSLITVFDYGVGEDGNAFYTMELLPGADLQSSAPAPWQTACKHLRDVASCLALLHSRHWLHRDVSPRNVKLDGQGRARLIDFGAMAPIGPGDHVVGTPPLMPPESLHGRSLDLRCDLFSLGATLYWTLTGRHAYPARTFAELPLVWQQPPEPPSVHAQGVPPTLDALVMALVALDPDARPRSAAEVIERLDAIASLEDDAHAHESQSYLTRPTLVEREGVLKEIQDTLRVAGTRSQGILVTGDPGLGRSRILDAAAVEMLLSGAHIIRLDSDGSDRSLAAMLSLLEQCGGDGTTAAATEALPTPTASGRKDRSELIAAARRRLRELTATGLVVLIADDAHELDRDSLEFLASLLGACRRRLLLLASTETGALLPASLQASRDRLRHVTLSPLSDSGTYAVLASMFGDDIRLSAVADRVHRLAHGNPQATLELAQHLVDRGIARYELGGWVLPDHLGDDDLPPAWADAITARLERLSTPARELAEALAVADGLPLELVALEGLMPGSGPPEVRSALDRLVEAGLVQMAGLQAVLKNSGHAQTIRDQLPTARHREICGHLADHLLGLGRDPVLASAYLQRAELPARAIEVLLGALSLGSIAQDAPAEYAQVLRQAVADADILRTPRRERFTLLRELIRVIELRGLPDQHVYFAEVFRQLSVDSGLNAYWQLPPSMGPESRLQEALRRSQRAWEQTPAGQRCLPPGEAVAAIAEAARQAISVYLTSMDAAVGASLPDLSPLCPLSPAIEFFVDQVIPASHALNAGRYEDAYRLNERVIDRLNASDHGGLGDEDWRWAKAQIALAMGHIMAGLGVPRALTHADTLDETPGWEMAAWDVRRAFHLRCGDIKTADRCRRRIAKLQLETGRRPASLDSSARLELDTAAHASDLALARRAMERLRPLIETLPGYAPYREFGPAVQAYIRGDYAEALTRSARALEIARPGEHPTWPWVAGCYLECLLGLRRTEDAAREARRMLAQAEAAGLRIMAQQISLPLAQAEAQLGEAEAAVERVDAAIAYREELGCHGLNLGWAYEHRARIAVTMGDSEGFLAALKRCGEAYGKGRGGSTLVGRYEQLLAQARAQGLLRPSMPVPPKEEEAGGWDTAVAAEFRGMTDEERANRALEIVLEQAGASAGALYRVSDAGVQLSATAGDSLEPLPALDMVTQLLPLHTELESDITTASDATLLATVRRSSTWHPLGLGHRDRRHGYCRTGLVLLQYDALPRIVAPRLLAALSREITPTAATTVS